MSGRYHGSRRTEDYHSAGANPRPVLSRLSQPLSASNLEKELREQHGEVQRIFAENRLIIEENTLLHRELSATKDEINRLDEVIPSLRAERETRQRDLIKRKTMLEADLRASEPLKIEIAQLRAEVSELNSARQELYMQIQGLTNVVNRFKDEKQKVASMKTDIKMLKKELVEARKDCEYEKKAAEEQAELRQAVEKNIEFMAREIEELRAEQLKSERRVHDSGVGRHERLNGSPEMRYPVGEFGVRYASTWRHYENRSPTRRGRMY